MEHLDSWLKRSTLISWSPFWTTASGTGLKLTESIHVQIIFTCGQQEKCSQTKSFATLYYQELLNAFAFHIIACALDKITTDCYRHHPSWTAFSTAAFPCASALFFCYHFAFHVFQWFSIFFSWLSLTTKFLLLLASKSICLSQRSYFSWYALALNHKKRTRRRKRKRRSSNFHSNERCRSSIRVKYADENETDRNGKKEKIERETDRLKGMPHAINNNK